MVAFGYHASSEEHGPADLIASVRRAEEAGLSFALVSDHYHPWLDQQGHSPFVWSVLGGIAGATERLTVGTGVTCPIMRVHPAIIAQAAATTALMMPGRFFLGVGTGEYLNEHILGEHWPPVPVRQEMLAEAIEVMRLLWRGRTESYWGDYFVVEDARIYSLPEQPPPLYVAASGPQSASLAGEHGDGLISLAPNAGVTRRFEQAGGAEKPKLAKLTVCWAESEAEARRVAFEQWASTAVPLSTDLRTPGDFGSVARLVREEDVAGKLILGPDPQPYVDAVQQYVEAGFDHIYFHQVGPDQEGFFRFFERDLTPRLEASPPRIIESYQAAAD
jgi:coenzyme F420-dependent glucose-6-phosphate dehydrogenase